jgi:hypothetical protein
MSKRAGLIATLCVACAASPISVAQQAPPDNDYWWPNRLSLELDHARPGVGEFSRAKRSGDGVLERHYSQSAQRTLETQALLPRP